MKRRLTIVVGLVVFGATFFVSQAFAQVRLRGPSAPARTGLSPRFGTRVGLTGMRYRQAFASPVLLPPYWYGGYGYGGYGGYEYEPIAEPAPQPPVIVVQQSTPAAPATAPVPSAVESLVLENQGGQWVRISNYSQAAAPAATKETSAPTKLPPTALVFKDGHTEDVERYMIKGDVIFTDADYWRTGSWTRRVPLAQLDLPATQKMNEARGGKFNLPSGPNEVFIR